MYNKPKRNTMLAMLKYSFNVSYVILLTTSFITIIEALRTTNPTVRHVLNLETAISLIAGYFYGLFIVKIDEAAKTNSVVDWSEITLYRYMDWSITTPIMLLALCLVLSSQIKAELQLTTYLMVVLLNYLMLMFGYLGENKIMERIPATIAGFVAFGIMFRLIFVKYVKPKYLLSNYILFSLYLTFWSLYGIVYLFDDEYKHLFTNYLDLITKCLIGLGLWAYYTKIITYG